MINIPIWLIYALIATVSVGLVNFIIKILVERGEHKFYFFFFSFLFLLISSLISIIFTGQEFSYTADIIIFSFIFSLLYYIILNTRFISLDNISSADYFINYKSILSLTIIVIGHVIFLEKFRIQDYIGLLIGFIIFYLFYKKEKTSKNINFKKGIKYLLIGVVLAVLLHSISKHMVSQGTHLFSILFFQGLFGILVTVFANIKNLKQEIRDCPNKLKDILLFGLCGTFNTIFLYYIFSAYEIGPIGIVYKIIAYAMFIPIVLSVIFYKEEINTRKFIAIILAVFSIFLFV